MSDVTAKQMSTAEDIHDHPTCNGDFDANDHDCSVDETFGELSLSGDTLEVDHFCCAACSQEFKQPRVLNCLHVFCQTCLLPLFHEDSIVCPTCQQLTDCDGVSELPLHHVITNSLDLKGIQARNILCTSCKAKEKAVARCSDCTTSNFLCPNCVTAHQFMRCFENHKVVSFEDIINNVGAPVHRPIICPAHSDEPMKYFCNTCQMPICNECMLQDHKQPGHQFERIVDIEKREMNQITSLVTEAQNRVSHLSHSTNNLQQSLTELESQRDDAKSLIQETFQSYKALLERRQDALLKQLEQLHEQQELAVMEMFHNISKVVEQIEHGCEFVKTVTENSNSVELLSLKKTMCQRLLSLMKSSPAHNISVDIEFVTDSKLFEKGVEDTFGHFKLRDDSVIRNQQGRTVERQTSMANAQTDLVLSGGAQSSGPAGYADMMPPMLGSPDSGLSSDAMSRPILSGHAHHDFSSSFHPISTDQLGLRNVGGSNMCGPVGEGRSQSRQSQSPDISDSGIGMDSNSPSATTSGTTPASVLNLAALARLGTVTLSPQGTILLNNHAIPDLTISQVSGLDQIMELRNDSPDQELQHQMSSGSSGMFSPTSLDMMSPTPMSGRSMMPSGSTIESVLGQRREAQGGMMIGPGSGFTSPTPTTQAGSGPPFPTRGKMCAMQIRAKFGQLGPSKGQFNSPHGFCMGMEEDIVVADTNNHRIQVFDKSGDFKYQFGIPGKEEGQLWYPRKVAVMKGTGRYVICDRGNERSRMQIFTKNGHFIKKIAIRYIDIVAGLAITPQGNIVAVDSVSPTVFTISEGGDLLKWFDCSDYMREPSDIAICDKEYYVCDFKGHCVVVFTDDGSFLRRIGTDSITNFPNGIDISDAGDVLVGDSHGNRFHVAVFQRDGSLIGEFECPYVKVSRCCGLKITSEGYVVTLAKNNHHVLVLNTLYIN